MCYVCDFMQDRNVIFRVCRDELNRPDVLSHDSRAKEVMPCVLRADLVHYLLCRVQMVICVLCVLCVNLVQCYVCRAHICDVRPFISDPPMTLFS